MFDDENPEIRLFVYEKLAELNNFGLITAKQKMLLFYFGLSDQNSKVQLAAKNLLKNYLNYIGVYRLLEPKERTNDNQMEIDDEKEKIESAHEKIEKATSPFKKKKKLLDSPSRVFDDLDMMNNLFHPKFSYTYQLIIEAILDITDQSNINDFIFTITDNIILVVAESSQLKLYSSEKKNNYKPYKGDKVDKLGLFNDVYFLQGMIKIIQTNKHIPNFKEIEKNLDLLFQNKEKSFTQILDYFYRKECNVLIFHQLLLIAQNLNFNEENENREFCSFLKVFIADVNLDSKLAMKNNTMVNDEDDDNDNFNKFDNFEENIDNNDFVDKEMQLENLLLPQNRVKICSMEDLIDNALKLLLKLNYEQHNQFFISIMEVSLLN